MKIRWMKQAAAVLSAAAVVLTVFFPAAVQTEAAEESVICRIRNTADGSYLTVDGEMAEKQGNLILREANGTLKQEFAVEKEEHVTFISQSNQKDLAVNVWGERTQSGSNVNLWEQTGETTQQWELVPVSGGYVIRSADNSDYVMSTYLENVQIERYSRGDRKQIWELIPVKESQESQITGLTLSAESGIVSRNHTMKLTLVCEPADGSLRLLAWESSDPEVLGVDQNGTVTAKKEGTAVISAVLPGGIRADLPLEVRDTETSGITVSDGNGNTVGSCPAGSEFLLTALSVPEDASDRRAEWLVSDPSVCSVDSFGAVSTLREGTAVITAVTSNGFSASYMLTVSNTGERTVPEAEITRGFFCNTPQEWEFTAALGGADRLRRTNAAGQTWVPSEIRDVKDYDDSFDRVLAPGYVTKENGVLLFHWIDREKYMSVLSDTPDWYAAVADSGKPGAVIDGGRLATGIWLLAVGGDASRYQYRISSDDFLSYLDGFAGEREVYYAWMEGDSISGLFQAETVTATPPSPEPTEPAPQPTEPQTQPTEPQTQPTEPAPQPTEPETQPTEPQTQPTEPQTQPTEPAPQPTEPQTQPTEPQTQPTEPAPQPTEPETAEETQTPAPKHILYENENGFSLFLPAEWEGRYTVKTASVTETDEEIAFFCRASDDAAENSGLLFDILLTQSPVVYLKENESMRYAADLADGRAVLISRVETDCAPGEDIAAEYAVMSDESAAVADSLSVFVCDSDPEFEMFAVLQEDDTLPVEKQIGIRYTLPQDRELPADEEALLLETRKLHRWVPEDVIAFCRNDVFETLLKTALSAETCEIKTGYIRMQEDGSAALEPVVSREDKTAAGEKIPLDIAALEGKIWLCSATMTGGETQYYFSVSTQDYLELQAEILRMDDETRPELLMEAVCAEGVPVLLYDTAQEDKLLFNTKQAVR